MLRGKKFADPLKILFAEVGEDTEIQVGVLYRWNNGHIQMRWDIDPRTLTETSATRWEGVRH